MQLKLRAKLVGNWWVCQKRVVETDNFMRKYDAFLDMRRRLYFGEDDLIRLLLFECQSQKNIFKSIKHMLVSTEL